MDGQENQRKILWFPEVGIKIFLMWKKWGCEHSTTFFCIHVLHELYKSSLMHILRQRFQYFLCHITIIPVQNHRQLKSIRRLFWLFQRCFPLWRICVSSFGIIHTKSFMYGNLNILLRCSCRCLCNQFFSYQ